MGLWVSICFISAVFGMVAFLVFLGWFRKPRALKRVEDLCPGIPLGREGFPQIKWLGHSSYRLEWGGQVILLDPVLSKRVSIAPRLMDDPRDLVVDGVDAILVTHAHMDHLDGPTLERVKGCDLYLPRRSERFLNEKLKAQHRVHTFEPGESFELGSLKITVVPAVHGGWRYPWQRGYFACGFIIEACGTILYYAGDTAWGEHFKDIAERFRPDIAILPIGGYSPRWFLKSRHVDPGEAARAARILGAAWIIPGHFGTYRVSLEPINEPLHRFRREISSF